MKTFEEAARLVFGFVDDPEKIKAAREQPPDPEAAERIILMQSAFMDDIQESVIGRNAHSIAYQLTAGIIEKVESAEQVIPNLFIHALAYGVSIGVQMEKHEE